MQAKDFMSKRVVTVTEEMTVAEVAKILIDKGISGLPVVDGHGRPIGVISQTDLVREERERPDQDRPHEFYGDAEKPFPYRGFQTRRPDMTRVSEIMTPMVIAAEEDTPLKELALMMLRKRIHRIVITRDGRIRGIISTLDILRAMLRQEGVPVSV